MEIIIAEAIGFKEHDGKKLLHAKKLKTTADKYKSIIKLFEKNEISFFYQLGIHLNRFMNKDKPLVFVTDWSDPTEMVGLLLEDDHQLIAYPDLGFLAFYTDWSDLESSGIEKIFSHEFSHLWLYNLGYDFNLSKSNKFHTITAITDPFMAFSEGFAEHLEIVSNDISNQNHNDYPYDSGFDIESWLSYRDTSLRYHGVINNRFIYLTALPDLTTYKTYAELHMAHITSSSFTPEHIKNGSQMMASEGVIASFFYYFYKNDYFKHEYQDETFYQRFGTQRNEISALTNHYLKILFALSKIDFTKESLMIDFVNTYSTCFPNEKQNIIKLFLKTTHFATMDEDNTHMFENLYTVGKLGNPDHFKKALLDARDFKEKAISKVLDQPELLKKGLYPSLWISSNQLIKPVPWNEDTVTYTFDVNTATSIDFMSLTDVDLPLAKRLLDARKHHKGFFSLSSFLNLKDSFLSSNHE